MLAFLELTTRPSGLFPTPLQLFVLFGQLGWPRLELRTPPSTPSRLFGTLPQRFEPRCELRTPPSCFFAAPLQRFETRLELRTPPS